MGHHVCNEAKAVNMEATSLRDMKIRDLLRSFFVEITTVHTDTQGQSSHVMKSVLVLVLSIHMGNPGSLSWHNV